MPDNLSDYRLLSLVGQGQFAQVYCALHRRTGRLVAIKQTRHAPEDASQEPFVLSSLSHPNVVSAQAIAQTKTGYQFVLDYCESGTLRSHLDTAGPLPLSTAKALISDVLKGLGHIHQQKIIHGDLKPENILLSATRVPPTPTGLVAKIGDLGGARFVELPQRSHREIGSPTYAAPERFDGCSSYASDLYSVGVMLYEVLLGNRPFSGSPHALRQAHQSQSASFPTTLTRPAQQLLSRALHKQPDQRFANAAAMLSAIEKLTAVYDVSAPGISNGPRAPTALTVPATSMPQPLAAYALVGVSEPVESLLTIPQGCCVLTARSFHILNAQKKLIPVIGFEQPHWFAISPDGRWFAAFPKPSSHASHQPPTPSQPQNQNRSQTRGYIFKLFDRSRGNGDLEVGSRRALICTGPLLSALRSRLMQILAIDSRYLLCVRTAEQRSKTYLELFTRRGQFVAQLPLNVAIAQIVPTAIPYQLIALSAPIASRASQVMLISLKPFQVRYLRLQVSPTLVSAFSWGYAFTFQPKDQQAEQQLDLKKQNILLLDRYSDPVNVLTGIPSVSAVAAMGEHTLCLAGSTAELSSVRFASARSASAPGVSPSKSGRSLESLESAPFSLLMFDLAQAELELIF